MAGLKISAADLVDNVTNEIKMPTGEVGDKAISVGQILRHHAETKLQVLEAPALNPNENTTGSFEIDALSIIPVMVNANTAARLRVYLTEQDRDGDLNRPVGMPRTDEAPVILEYITTVGFLGDYLRKPFVLPIIASELFHTITNLSTSTTPISFEIGYQGGF